MEKKITFAVVGIGHIGKRHVEMISRNRECELVALIDIRSKEQLAMDKYAVPFFKSVDEFLKSSIQCDVVCIASPNGLHGLQALQCIEAYKHVIIEKPLALTTGDAEKVLKRAQELDVHLFAVMQNRYSAPSIWLKELVSNGILGRIFIVQLNCFWNRDKRYYLKDTWHGKKDMDGGTLFTQFSHFIDLLYWVFGDIDKIQGRMNSFNHRTLTEFEDSGIVGFDLLNGGIGSLNFSTAIWDKNLESSILVIGELGSVRIGGQYMDRIEYCHIENYTIHSFAVARPEGDATLSKGSNNHQYVIQHVVDVLLRGVHLSPEPEQAVKVIDIIQRIYKAIR